MSSSNTTVLITGANRGIGRGLLASYLARPSHTAIAAVRDPQHATTLALQSLPKGSSSALIIVKIDSTSQGDAATAVHTISSAPHNITALDIVIANAGIAKSFPKVAEAKTTDLKEHHDTNVLGPLTLFQATLPLLNRAKLPKFVAIGSSAGSIGGMENRLTPNSVYGPSKAALHYLTRKMHFEHENLVAFPIDPGWVQTDMGNAGANYFGLKEAETSIEDSVGGIVKVIDGATRESTSGKLPSFSGGETPW